MQKSSKSNWENQPSCSHTPENNNNKIFEKFNKYDFNNLHKLEKKPLDDYFVGLGEKKKSRKKAKPQKVISFEELVSRTTTNDTIEPETSNEVKDTENEETNSKIEDILLKHRKEIFFQEHMNNACLRAKERHCLEGLENLAETWYELIQRRRHSKETVPVRNSFDQRKKTTQFNICLLSKKYWNDEDDSTKSNLEEKKEKKIQATSLNVIDEVQSNFEKLIFVDSVESD